MSGDECTIMASPGQNAQPEEQSEQKKVRTEGLWIKCDSCRAIIWKKDLEANLMVCTKCGFHFKISARSRLEWLFDDDGWREFDSDLRTTDVLEFVDQKSYQDRLEQAERNTGLKDAIISAEGTLAGWARCRLRHGIPVYRRQHGGRGGGEDQPGPLKGLVLRRCP